MTENIKNKIYIIGLGTGRCGTKSLAKLLNDCQEVNVSHEFRREGYNHYLSWYYKDKFFKKRYDDLLTLEGKFIGDVASYYLNYIEEFKKKLPKLKVIYLYRNISEVIDSFMIKTQRPVGREVNHWLSHKHKLFKEERFIKMKWDVCFPKYRIYNTKRELIKKYCEDYNIKIQELKEKYSNLIFPIDVKFLNDKLVQKALFDFIGIPKKYRNYQKVNENVGKK